MQPSGTVVVLANVDGASKAVLPAGYTFTNGVIAWSSPAGGAAFGTPGQGLANEGKLLANSRTAGDMPAAGAVALDETHILAYGDSYPFGSGATDFTLAAPAPARTPVVDHSGTFVEGFADGAQIASAPAGGGQYLAVAVGGDPKGCGAGEEAGFSFLIGTPAALQSGDVARLHGDRLPGQLAGAGRRRTRRGRDRRPRRGGRRTGRPWIRRGLLANVQHHDRYVRRARPDQRRDSTHARWSREPERLLRRRRRPLRGVVR